MDNPPSLIQASIPSTFLAPTLTHRVLDTTNASTITSNTIQTNPLYVSTLIGSTIQTNTLYGSTIVSNNIGINTLLTYSLAGNTIQTDTMLAAALTGSTIQTNTLYAISLIGSTIQTNTCSTLLVSSSTIQVNTITTSTVACNIIQTNTYVTSTLVGSTIQTNLLKVSTLIGTTIQSNTIKVSMISGSTFQHNQLHTNILGASTIFANVFQPTILQGSTIMASNIQANTTNASTLILMGNTFQANNFNFNTITGSTIQAYAVNISTLLSNTIIGCTIQVNTVNCSTVPASTIQGNQLNLSTLIGSTSQIKQVTVSIVQCSTLIGSTIQTNQCNVSTITASAIQSNIIQTNTLVCETLQINTIMISSLTGSTIQTSILQVSTLSGSTIQVNTLQVSTLSGSTIQTLQLNISTLVCSTIQTDRLDGSTILYSTIQTNTLSASIIRPSTIIGSTIQTDTLQLSSLSCSTIIGSIFNTNKILTTDGNKTLVTSNIDVSNLPYITNLTSHAGGQGQANTWTSAQTFSASPIFTGLTSEPPTYALGVNASNQLIKYPPIFSMQGTLTPNYIPYASNASTLSNSIIYRVNATDVAIGQTTSAFPTGTGTTLSVAGQTQVTNVVAETGTFAKIDTPDKRSGVNGLHIPNGQGCNFYMGTMNNNGTGNYTDTLYLNSIPTFDMTDSINVYNNIVVVSLGPSSGTGFQTMPSFTPSATGLTISALIMITGSTMPPQWARIIDMGNLRDAPTRGFLIAFQTDRTIICHYRASDQTITPMISTTQLTLNTMYHIVWTVDTLGNHVLYINGQQAATMTKVVSLDTYPYFYLGMSNWKGDPFPNMTMFDFRMMNRSLSSSDVMGLYCSVKKISGTSIISGQYIVLNRPDGDYLNLAEIQVFSYEGGPNIITPSTSVTFSDMHPLYPVSSFVDGNLNTIMHSSGTTNSTVTINLGSTQTIYKIIIYNRIDCCWNRANGIVLTIRNSSNTTVYTASPIPDKLGRTTVIALDTINLTDYYYTFTYFPPYAAVIGDLEKTEASMSKINAVMFNKGTPGMRMYQGFIQASVPYTVYKDLVMVSDVNSGNLLLGSGSNTDGITFGPNASWRSYLKVGAGNNREGVDIAQVTTTNGDLHLSCATNTRGIYLNFYVKDELATINSYSPLTHNNSLTVTGSVSSSSPITTQDWYYINGSGGINWTGYGDRGIVSPERAGNAYGTVSAWKSGRGGRVGWGLGSTGGFFTDGDDYYGIYNNAESAIIYCYTYSTTHKYITIGGSVIFLQGYTVAFAVLFNGVNFDGGYFYLWEGGIYNSGVISDERIKTNIKPIDPNISVDFMNRVIPSYFCLKEADPCMQKNADGKEEMVYPSVSCCEQSGFIAQNVLESATKAGLPKSIINRWYDYEQELLLPEKDRKTILGVSIVPLTCHLVNVLKTKMKMLKEQQEKISVLQHKLAMYTITLNNVRETVRQQTELLQQLTAKP